MFCFMFWQYCSILRIFDVLLILKDIGITGSFYEIYGGYLIV